MSDLISLFDSLAIPSTQDTEIARFTAQPIQSFERYRIAKDADSAPTLLISVSSQAGNSRPNPIAIEHLIVQHDVDCRISRPDGKLEEGRFTLIRCRGEERILHIYFLRVAGALIMALGTKPSQQDVASAINKLVELFRVMSEPSRKSVQGLWAELLLIVRSQDPAVLVSAWHSHPNDLYDFSKDNQRIEVKSVIGRLRRHHFSLEQLSPLQNTKVLVASVLVERAGGGVSITDLIDQIRSKIATKPDLLFHLDYIVGLILGDGWRSAIEDRFDWELAINSIAFFEADAIPSIRANVPPEVSNISFVSDLSQIARADTNAYRARGGLFNAALR